MPRRFPAEIYDWMRYVEACLKEDHVDIQRLWKRIGVTPTPGGAVGPPALLALPGVGPGSADGTQASYLTAASPQSVASLVGNSGGGSGGGNSNGGSGSALAGSNEFSGSTGGSASPGSASTLSGNSGSGASVSAGVTACGQCVAASSQIKLSANGWVNGSCSCNGYEGDHILDHVSSCTWVNNGSDLCGNGNSQAILSFDGTWSLVVFGITYSLVGSYNCLGLNTWEWTGYPGSGAVCVWPQFVTTEPA